MKISELVGGAAAPEPGTPAEVITPEVNPPANPNEGGENPEGDEPENPSTDPVTPEDPDTPPPAEGEEELPTDEEEEEDQGPSIEEFYRTLDAMHGEEVNSQIDYGDVDPNSAEGVFRREQFIANKAVEKYVSTLQQSDPRAYAYLLHRQNGGSDESFFESKSFILPEESELMKDPDLQKSVYHKILVSRGNTPKQADALVRIAVEDGELSKEALEGYRAMKAEEKKEFENAQRIATEERERTAKAITEFGGLLNKAIETNEGLGFNIPAADKDKFNTYIRDKIYYDKGKFHVIQEVTPQNLPKVLETELFSYLGGDLNKLVTRKAGTMAAQRFVRKVESTNKPISGSGTHRTPRATTLGSIL